MTYSEIHTLVMVSVMVPHSGGDGILLSDTKIRQAKAKATAYQLSDERGLYLLMKPTGGKLWRWNYRHKGIQKTMSFGQYPDVPLVQARERLPQLDDSWLPVSIQWSSARSPRPRAWQLTPNLSRPSHTCGWSTGRLRRASSMWTPHVAVWKPTFTPFWALAPIAFPTVCSSTSRALEYRQKWDECCILGSRDRQGARWASC
jgi:hypothetical protein